MKRVTPLVLLLFTLSGVSGLIYEIVWIRMLSHLLGGTSYAISTVLATFMGGLALGSRFFGPHADRSVRPLALYARLELGIAALATVATILIRMAPPAYVAIAGDLPTAALAGLRVLIVAVLLLPPTFLMGGTLPVLSHFVVKRRAHLGRGLGLLYAMNTLGAVLGSFLAGYVLIASVGLTATTTLAVIINVAIGLAVLMLDRRFGAATHDDHARPAGDPDATGETINEMNGGLLAIIFALSGFASLGYELYWTRALQHFLGNSTYAFSAMLTTFLFGLAAGGWIGGRWADRVRSPARLLGWTLLGVGFGALATVLLLYGWLPEVRRSAWLSDINLSWTAYLGRRFLVAFAVMAVPTLMAGMTFPIVNRIGISNLKRMGRGVGGLYFANTVGSIVGSLAAGFLFLQLLGAHTALIVTGLFSVTLGVIVHFANRARGRVEPWVGAALLLAMIIASPQLDKAGETLMSNTQDPQDWVLFNKEDHAAETRVYRKSNGVVNMSVDGWEIGGTEPSLLRKEKILAHLPMVLCPTARTTLSVGLGSGITLGTMSLYKDLTSLVCVEIVPGVVDGARFFSQENKNVLVDHRLKLITGDGVQYLLTTPERFDIIGSDSKLNPEYAGNASLLSKDYYELCRDRLTETGVMVQWLACHLPHDDILVIARSFVESFPEVALYWLDPGNMILAGSKVPLVLDMGAARRFNLRKEIAADLADLQLDDPYVFGSLWICGRDQLLAYLGEGPTNSWQRPRIAFTMARNFRSKPTAYHEDDNMRWLSSMRDPQAQSLAGTFDPDTLASFVISSGKLLEGFAVGGGTAHLENGLELMREGHAANPADRRLAKVVSKLEEMSDRIESEYSSGNMNSPAGLVQVGLRRRDQGRHQESLRLFEQALAMKPDDPEIQYNRLIALRSVGRNDDFGKALQHFRGEFPRDARGYSLQGRLLSDQGRFEDAIVEFKKATELDPLTPAYLNNLATTLARLERYEEAALAFAEVSRLQPSFNDAAFFAAASFSLAGRVADAARWARFCLDKGLVKPDRFRDASLFANLHKSEYWDKDLGQLRK